MPLYRRERAKLARDRVVIFVNPREFTAAANAVHAFRVLPLYQRMETFNDSNADFADPTEISARRHFKSARPIESLSYRD